MTSEATNNHDDTRRSSDMGMLGMKLLIASLSMLFLASIVGFVVIRSRAAEWPPPNMPPLPWSLWISTVVILLSSVTMWRALSYIRRDDQSTTRTMLAMTLFLGLVFLASQTYNWMHLVAAQMTIRSNLYAFMFYLLTALHAAHVAGGLVALGITTTKAFRGRYNAHYHPGVQYTNIYWHWLDGVWLVMLLLIFVLS